MNLREALEEALADLEGVEQAEAGGGVEWRRGGLPFAALVGDAAEFRLDPLGGEAPRSGRPTRRHRNAARTGSASARPSSTATRSIAPRPGSPPPGAAQAS